MRQARSYQMHCLLLAFESFEHPRKTTLIPSSSHGLRQRLAARGWSQPLTRKCLGLAGASDGSSTVQEVVAGGSQ
eukprot:4908786-Amphidinium_carterae.1